MHLYTYVSILAVLTTTVILYIIFRQNNLKDSRYHIGLFVSAVIALIASLFLPNIVSVITVDWALQFVLAFFIALLAYITLIFLVMMLVAAVLPKEKSDKLFEKWEKWKSARKERKTEKQKEPDENAEPVPQAADDLKQQEPVLKNIFIRKFSLKKDEANGAEEDKIHEVPTAETEYSEDEIRETPVIETEYAEDEIQGVPAVEAQHEEDNLQGMPVEEAEPEIIPESTELPESGQEVFIDTVEGETIAGEEHDIQSDDSYETSAEREVETLIYEEPQAEEMQEADEQKLPDDTDNSELYETSQGILVEKGENTEKNVDTLDIIDKMGLDTVTDSDELSPVQLSMEELLDRAFLLKQEGRELEAASLYINALDMKPDTEVAFWIVLDICVIYKNFGRTELATDILQAYVNEYDNLLSNEVKEQIMQSLYF
jgi:tetratricopeptide (TPR) repeat protein